MMYQENILDHYKNPHNHGEIKNPTVQHQGYNPLCGDEIELFIIVESNKIKEVKFVGKGCAISKASASMLTDEIKEKSLEELKKMTKEDILKMLGIQISPVRLKCALLSLDTLKNSIKIYENYIQKNNKSNGGK